MTLTKKKMIREVGRRTRLRNHDVQCVLETLIELWSDELAVGGRIELQNFLVLEVQRIDRGPNPGRLTTGPAQRIIHQLVVRPSKRIRKKLSRIEPRPKPNYSR